MHLWLENAKIMYTAKNVINDAKTRKTPPHRRRNRENSFMTRKRENNPPRKFIHDAKREKFWRKRENIFCDWRENAKNLFARNAKALPENFLIDANWRESSRKIPLSTRQTRKNVIFSRLFASVFRVREFGSLDSLLFYIYLENSLEGYIDTNVLFLLVPPCSFLFLWICTFSTVTQSCVKALTVLVPVIPENLLRFYATHETIPFRSTICKPGYWRIVNNCE